MNFFSKIFLWIVVSMGIIFGAHAGFLSDIFQESQPQVHYCEGGECGLQQWIEQVKGIDGLVTDRKASVYVQDIVKYLLGFLYLFGVVLIIYAWFQLVVWAWSDDKVKTSKNIIIYVVIGIVIIFLAGPIVNFILKILSVPSGA